MPQRLELGKTVDAMKDGSIDGFVWSGGLPTGGVTDLFTSAGDRVEFVDISSLLPKMKEINPVYAEGTVPAAAYGTPADVKTIVVPNLLLVRKDFPANDACAITSCCSTRRPTGEGAPGGEGARPEDRRRHGAGRAGPRCADRAGGARLSRPARRRWSRAGRSPSW